MDASASPSPSPSILTPTTTASSVLTRPATCTPLASSSSTITISPTTAAAADPPKHDVPNNNNNNNNNNSSNSNSNNAAFTFPAHHSFPPFFTLQPNLTTLSRQLSLWSELITSYCAATQTFTLTLSPGLLTIPASSSTVSNGGGVVVVGAAGRQGEAPNPSTALFTNARINRSMDILGARKVLDHMCSSEDRRAEWIIAPTSTSSSSSASSSSKAKLTEARKSTAYIWFRSAEGWGQEVYSWVVDETGQRGSVLTVYELLNSDATEKEKWRGMDEGMFRRCLDTLVKKGRAQVFDTGDGEGGVGVKFF
ncbi:hypothetical protein AAFC00_005473 [Neodothiora populina]|uniref:Uncharacterized protein n=1 Tax=Neodothiora populina TaxID=2781224 RepID=A0ABR3PM29_9PEZI